MKFDLARRRVVRRQAVRSVSSPGLGAASSGDFFVFTLSSRSALSPSDTPLALWAFRKSLWFGFESLSPCTDPLTQESARERGRRGRGRDVKKKTKKKALEGKEEDDGRQALAFKSDKDYGERCDSLYSITGWETAHVIGHSMRAMIAWKLAAMVPNRVLSLGLLNVTGGGYECFPKFKGLLLIWIPTTQKNILRNMLDLAPGGQFSTKPRGSEALPEGIVTSSSDLEMRPLWVFAKDSLSSLSNLFAVAVGIKQKDLVNKMVTNFLSNDFVVMLFHYDGVVDEWKT
ncbi:hypothetical protein NL676_035381 [Syzygium grande]|nr:hypothetical protein NL676_035381 [Syzygium grande]